jgi:hypothetical protein
VLLTCGANEDDGDDDDGSTHIAAASAYNLE